MGRFKVGEKVAATGGRQGTIVKASGTDYIVDIGGKRMALGEVHLRPIVDPQAARVQQHNREAAGRAAVEGSDETAERAFRVGEVVAGRRIVGITDDGAYNVEDEAGGNPGTLSESALLEIVEAVKADELAAAEAAEAEAKAALADVDRAIADGRIDPEGAEAIREVIRDGRVDEGRGMIPAAPPAPEGGAEGGGGSAEGGAS